MLTDTIAKWEIKGIVESDIVDHNLKSIARGSFQASDLPRHLSDAGRLVGISMVLGSLTTVENAQNVIRKIKRKK